MFRIDTFYQYKLDLKSWKRHIVDNTNDKASKRLRYKVKIQGWNIRLRYKVDIWDIQRLKSLEYLIKYQIKALELDK